MKFAATAAALGLAALLSTPVLAGSSHAGMDHVAQGMDHGAAGMSQPMTEGTVKKLDKTAGKLTIAHGPLENLGMPGMTMVFRAKDAAMLDQVKAGDKIRFTAERIGGAFTVIALEPAE